MNYIRKFKKNSKALSPVVASIILIAVTVAVSVVVAAWMGGMTIGLMGSAEQASVTNIAFDSTSNTLQVLVQNSGSNPVVINSAFVNGVAVQVPASFVYTPAQSPSPAADSIPKGTSATVTLPLPGTTTLNAGAAYTVKLVTAKGTQISSTATYSP